MLDPDFYTRALDLPERDQNLQAAICSYFDFESPYVHLPAMSLVKDITVGEGEAVPPATRFIKTWRLHNPNIIAALRPYCKVASMTYEIVTCKGYSWTTGSRKAFVLLNEGWKLHQLPAKLVIISKGESTTAFITYDVRCSKCHRQGHRRATCPLGTPQSRTANLQDNQSGSLSTFIASQPTSSQNPAAPTSAAMSHDTTRQTPLRPSRFATSLSAANLFTLPQRVLLPLEIETEMMVLAVFYSEAKEDLLVSLHQMKRSFSRSSSTVQYGKAEKKGVSTGEVELRKSLGGLRGKAARKSNRSPGDRIQEQTPVRSILERKEKDHPGNKWCGVNLKVIWVIVTVAEGGLLGVTQQMEAFHHLGSPPRLPYSPAGNPFALANPPTTETGTS
ncbi:C6orf106 [Cordylochernes scorpioides]|uniref:C6orf106 n=1 Tax=Cordylochernes scorpioides TaxID=51811 RepID=A0ABY6L8C7_9ARAC|nr:C6orf106 [Cordylochernes scorpioides]